MLSIPRSTEFIISYYHYIISININILNIIKLLNLIIIIILMIIESKFKLLALELVRRWDAEVLDSFKPKHHAPLEMAAPPTINNHNDTNNNNNNDNNKLQNSNNNHTYYYYHSSKAAFWGRACSVGHLDRRVGEPLDHPGDAACASVRVACTCAA